MKSCKTCAYCKRFYALFYTYGKRGGYCCTANDKIIQSGDACEKWRKKVPEYDLSPQRFDEAQKDIKILIELLKDI